MGTDLSSLGFNTKEVKDMGDGFKVYPPGVYAVVIVDSEMVETKNKDGWMLYLTYQFIDGQFVGETIKDNFNVQNKSQKAQDIAWSNLNQICAAVGFVGQLGKLESQIYGKPFSVKIGIIKSEKINPKTNLPFDNNEVSKRMAREATVIGQMPVSSTTQQTTGTGATGTQSQPQARPWG